MHPKITLVMHQKQNTKHCFYWLHWEDKKVFLCETCKEGIFYKGVKWYRELGSLPCIVKAMTEQEVIDKFYKLAVKFLPELQDLYQRHPVEN